MEGKEEQPVKADGNEERRTKLLDLADEDVEREQREAAEARSLIDADEMVNYAKTPRKLVLPSIGGYVMYCPLRIEDRAEIMKIKDNDPDVQLDKRNRHTVYVMLKRADDRWTQEKVYNLPAAWIDVILIEYAAEEHDRFLQPVYQRRRAGLARTRKPRK